MLENIELKQAVIEFVNKFYGHLEGINKIRDNLNLLGLYDK